MLLTSFKVLLFSSKLLPFASKVLPVRQKCYLSIVCVYGSSDGFVKSVTCNVITRTTVRLAMETSLDNLKYYNKS